MSSRGGAGRSLGPDSPSGPSTKEGRAGVSEPVAYDNRGLVQQDQGDLSGAISDFERAVEMFPPDSPDGARAQQTLAAARARLPGPRPGDSGSSVRGTGGWA